METITPVKTDQISPTVVAINWSDGHESLFFAAHLRKNCPCADCETRKKNLGDKAFPFVEEAQFRSVEPKGRYAIAFSFDDGHSTGIYTYQYLRSLCQCDECTGNVVRIQGPLA